MALRKVLAAAPPVPLAARIEVLERELVALRQVQRHEDDARFLRTIAVTTRGAVFSVGDLIVRAALDADLRDALGGRRPKQLGKRLAALAGRARPGLSVRRVLHTNRGCLWELHFNQDAGAGD